MKIPYVQRTVRFDPQQYARLEELATKHSRSMAEVMRLAIAHYLSGEQKRTESQLRHLRVTEYVQVALDAIIRENHPELRDQLIVETDQRVRRYHGA